MATKSIVARNNKRAKMHETLKNKRIVLKNIIKDLNVSYEEKYSASVKLSKIPRNSSSVRLKRICQITGRSKGVYRKFNMCRQQIREFASYGLITGLVKASW